MIGTFGMAGYRLSSMAADSATHDAARANRRVRDVRQHVRMLEANLAKALMINEALWEIIKERHNLNEDHLNEKLYQIDMRDGQLDGKNQRSEPIKCPKCKRPVSSRHPACIYCGHEIDDSVFRMS